MKITPTNLTLVLWSILWLLPNPEAAAVEGGLGRPVSGAGIMPYAGLVPPAPGFAVTLGETYYDASIGGSTTVPIGQNLTLGLDLKVSFTPVSFQRPLGSRI